MARFELAPAGLTITLIHTNAALGEPRQTDSYSAQQHVAPPARAAAAPPLLFQHGPPQRLRALLLLLLLLPPRPRAPLCPPLASCLPKSWPHCGRGYREEGERLQLAGRPGEP